jgi:hypothetical protein
MKTKKTKNKPYNMNNRSDLPEFASVTTKQWFQFEVELDIFIHLQYFIKFNLDFGTIVLWSLKRIWERSKFNTIFGLCSVH